MNLNRLEGELKGSQIYNISWENKSLIKKHIFWEIWEGLSTLFWEDSWNQIPNIHQINCFQELKYWMNNKQMTKL